LRDAVVYWCSRWRNDALSNPIDPIDLRILQELQTAGRISIVDLSQRIGLSSSPCLRRLRNLEERGIIHSYRALLEPKAVGLHLQAFVFFKVVSYDRAEIQHLIEVFASTPEVLASYNLSGDYDAMLHVIVPSLTAFERFMHDKLLPLRVRDVRSSFVIGVRKPPAPLPLDHLKEASA
jgi:Lrp/AsnC family leucine-responsive transcriptional regulator